MARKLGDSLPESYEEFQKQEAEVRRKELRAPWTHPVSGVRLDTTLGTVTTARPIIQTASQDIVSKPLDL